MERCESRQQTESQALGAQNICHDSEKNAWLIFIARRQVISQQGIRLSRDGRPVASGKTGVSPPQPQQSTKSKTNAKGQ
jgi:hypothetical protein